MLSDKSQDAYQANNQIQNPNFNLEITSEEDLDPDVMNSMTSLGCFKDKEMLIEQLLRFVPVILISWFYDPWFESQSSHNFFSGNECTEKYVYQLLLKRKERHPSLEDDENKFPYDSSRVADRPRKRTDSTSSLNSLTSKSRKNSLISLQNSSVNGRVTPSTVNLLRYLKIYIFD